MSVTFRLEDWATYRRDCDRLWLEHHAELAPHGMTMRPDEGAYEALDRAGMLKILTARDGGILVGYVIAVVRRHLHYADYLCAFEDAYYLARSHRHGMTGVRLLRAWVRAMQALGCVKLFVDVRPWLDVRRVWLRLGFEASGWQMALSVGRG